MEILIIILLTLLNGFFALSEIALVSVKKSRMEALAAAGSSRAKIILKLLANPENFLSSVQVGITLIGIVAGAYGGAALTDDLERYLLEISFPPASAHEVAMVVVIGSITYFSIVVGELVPKSISLNNPEPVALICVPVIRYFIVATYPFVKLLSFSTALILKILRIKDPGQDRVSEDELRFLLKTAGKQGVLEKDESIAHQNLFYFSDQTARSLITERQDVEWINIEHSLQQIRQQLRESVHSKFLVCRGEIDQIEGVITARDFFERSTQPGFRIHDILNKPIFITQHTLAFEILNIFKVRKQYIGVVVDEYGSVTGIVTLHDLVEVIVGDLPDEDESDERSIHMRSDGSFLVDGKTLIYELNQHFQREVIRESIRQYATVSGFILDRLGHIPQPGSRVEADGMVLEVMDMDGVRIDKVLLTLPEK